MSQQETKTQPRRRPPMSLAQRIKLSIAQRAYVANDPRWPEHRRKLAAAQEAKRMTLLDNEVAAIVAMRKKGRTFSYIAEEIGVCREVIERELKALGISTAPVRADRRARRGRGFWRCFD
jgi:DNA-binding NarL/FixJ family response regulator